MSAQNYTRTYKRGELLFQEGDSIENLFLVHSGKVKTFLQRGKSIIEIQQLNAPSVFGEVMMFYNSKFLYSCLAMTDVTVLQIPIDSMKSMYEGLHQIAKSLIKSLVEENKNLVMSVKTYKLGSDNAPCPDEIITRLFGGIFYFVNHVGEKQKDERRLCSWPQMKQYCFRVFNLPIDKVENACNLMCKLGFVEFVYEESEEDPELGPQLTKLIFKDHNKIEQFFEFFQYYFYKSGKQEMLKVDENIIQIVRGILNCTAKEIPDRQGLIRVPLNPVLEYIKTQVGINITSTHWTLFDQRGLFSKRSTVDNVFYYIYNLEEFNRYYNASRFLREIQKWNLNGVVNPKELEFAPLASEKPLAPGEERCPQCNGITNKTQKFCGECGAKLKAAA